MLTSLLLARNINAEEDSRARSFLAFQGNMVFAADDGTTGLELWIARPDSGSSGGGGGGGSMGPWLILGTLAAGLYRSRHRSRQTGR